jgi:hypothetical protein
MRLLLDQGLATRRVAGALASDWRACEHRGAAVQCNVGSGYSGEEGCLFDRMAGVGLVAGYLLGRAGLHRLLRSLRPLE